MPPAPQQAAGQARPARRLTAIQDDAPVHDARELTGSVGSARIVLDGAVYTLRITRQGKLILTK